LLFADLTPGFVVRTPPRVVTAKEIVEFASRYDPQWFHTDAERARKGPRAKAVGRA
jgi:acyl dehydratase